MLSHREYTLGEEIFSSVSHGIGACLGIAALVILIVESAHQEYLTVTKIVSSAIFGTSIILMYLSSMFYHCFPQESVKKVFKIFDHCSIFLLIAGTYTPYCLIVLPEKLGWILFGCIWTLAIVGIIFKIFNAGKFIYTSTIFYILMGWLVLFALKPFYTHLPFGGFVLLAAGCISYTLGTIFYLLKKAPYSHSIWHLFVLAGTILQFFSVLLYVIPFTPYPPFIMALLRIFGLY